jgi:peptidoglycan/LPS O-acetylase OafA/YrhL
MRPGERLAALEGLRGYAAMLVYFTHAFGMLLAKLYQPADAEHFYVFDGASLGANAVAFLFHSNYGVDLFFILSGLLMADIAAHRWPGTGRFLSRRLLRIYPPYLASAIVVALVVYFTMERPVAVGEGFANLALLQGFFPLGIHAINPVTWSLSYEAAFYLAVPMVALAWGTGDGFNRANRALALLAAFVAIVAVCALVPGDRVIYLAYFALFIPGLALGMLDDETRRALAHRLPAAVALGVWIAFAASVKTGILSNLQPVYYFASALACGLVVLKACDAGSALARVLEHPVMRGLGRYSYSFFLMHYIVVHVWAGIVTSWLGTGNRARFAAVFVVGSLALSLAAARLLYEATERFYFAARKR